MTDLQKQEWFNFAKMVKSELIRIDKKNQDLAAVIGVSVQTFSNWMNGLVSLATYKDRVMAGLNILRKESVKNLR